MNTDQFQYTAQVFDSYEKRFAAARLNKPLRDPSDAADRADILREAREMLCIDKIPAPTIDILDFKDEKHGGVTVRIMQFRSWEHCYGEASLFLPSETTKRCPAVVICNGHSPQGRMGAAYQRVAFRLASRGITVLMSDNLGQGSRKEFGHWEAEAPLCGGITLQGMIVAESNAWIEWLAKQPFVDASRIGACGNSGGGTLTLFLIATNPRLAVAASSGYPSEFSYLLQKEKKHCGCNLLRGCAHRADMWEIYSTFAPKPLLLSGGKWDNLIPADVLRRTIRKVRTVYGKAGAADSLEFAVTDTKHPWEEEDHAVLTEFFCRRFGVLDRANAADTMPPMEEECRFTYPDDAISTNRLAEQLLGIVIDEKITLSDRYPPVFENGYVDVNRLAEDLFPTDPMRILTQMEIALTE